MSQIAVVTILIGNRHNNIAKISHPTQKAYAKKIGADFVVYDGEKYTVHSVENSTTTIISHQPVVNLKTFTLSKPAFGSYNKLNLIELFERYKRILYIDTDIVIRDDSPSLFEIVPETTVGMMDESTFIKDSRSSLISSWAEKFNFDDKRWNGHYYGGGVFLLSDQHRKLLDPPSEFYDDGFYEQTLFNWNIINNSIPMYDISYKFNRVSYMDEQLMEPRHSSYFIHYAGSWMLLKEGHSEEANFLIKLMQHDLDKWNANSPEHNYKPLETYIRRSFWVRD